jgi:hypothetical protein
MTDMPRTVEEMAQAIVERAQALAHAYPALDIELLRIEEIAGHIERRSRILSRKLRALPATVLDLADDLVPTVEDRSGVPPRPVGFLSLTGAAEYLGVSRQRVWQLKEEGRLRPDRVDAHGPLFRPETLTSFLDRQVGA